MISENIKKYRKKKGMSQEELAVKLHVVRQTVSKWEKSLSVPDAEVLVRMASLLDVPISSLLGVEFEDENVHRLTDELARLNEQIVEMQHEQILRKRAGEKRGIIIFLSFLAMFINLSIKRPEISILLSGFCIIIAVIILYRNLTLLTRETTTNMKLKILRLTTIFNLTIVIVSIFGSMFILLSDDMFLEYQEKIFAIVLITSIIIFVGIISPKLPFTRHTGLRLPWTIRDEDTWNVAHKIIGIISLPIACLYVGCSLTIENFKIVTLIAVMLWIGIPAFISYCFYIKKMYYKY
ncbi:helix-turn-helix domain-containing protein [Faecalimonas sp.]